MSDNVENESDINMINIALNNMTLRDDKVPDDKVPIILDDKVTDDKVPLILDDKVPSILPMKNSLDDKVPIILDDKVTDGKLKNKNNIKIDFTKTVFTPMEKELIRKEVELIKEKYPQYIPIIIRPKNKSIEMLRYKFLVNGDITVGQFMCIIRKKIRNIKSSEALFLIVNNTLAPSTNSLSLVYTQQVDKETNMLFFTLCNENTFGKN
jgi:hypothetical protein